MRKGPPTVLLKISTNESRPCIYPAIRFIKSKLVQSGSNVPDQENLTANEKPSPVAAYGEG